MFERELPAFAKRVQNEVADRIEAGEVEGGPYSEIAFTEYVMGYLAEIGMVEDPRACHFEGTWGRGQGQVRLSGFAISEEEDRLDLFTTIFGGGSQPGPVPREEIAKAAARAARFFDAACNGIGKAIEPAHPISELATRVEARSGKIDRVRVFVLTDGIAGATKVNATELEGTPVRFEIFDLERLFKGMQSGQARDEISIDFVEMFGTPIPCLPAAVQATDYSAYLALIPAEVLFRLYDEYGSRLLELNVRSFLSARGKVNRGVRATLLKAPDRFLAYNNGIVVTVDSIKTEVLAGGGVAIRSVTGLQIVNGGQTTASIHHARKIDRADLASVQVPAKITVIKAEKLDEMVGMISTYANSQNPVQPADFSANDPFHIRIEELANTVWCPGDETRWFYERARGSYQVALAREGTTARKAQKFKERTPPDQRLTKTELAKYLNAWDQRPDSVSYGEQKNFDRFMQGLRAARRADWMPDAAFFKQLVAKAILWRTAHRVVKQEKARELVLSQPANVTAYLVSYLAWRTGGNLNLELVWQRQSLSEELTDLFRTWAVKIDLLLREGTKGRMVSEWAKKDTCWSGIKAVELPLPGELPPEMASRTVPGSTEPGEQPLTERLGPEDYRNIEICKGVDGPAWLAIHAWGKKTGDLRKWQIGIAHTLAGYAASGWEHGPSPKQAKHGVGIVDAARAGGLKLPGSSVA